MVTTAEGPKEPTTTKEDIANTVAAIRANTSSAFSVLLTGRDAGGVRRNLLWLAAFALIIVGLPLLALLPMVLLALTDAVLV
jgi:hypothetical protein